MTPQKMVEMAAAAPLKPLFSDLGIEDALAAAGSWLVSNRVDSVAALHGKERPFAQVARRSHARAHAIRLSHFLHPCRHSGSPASRPTSSQSGCRR